MASLKAGLQPNCFDCHTHTHTHALIHTHTHTLSQQALNPQLLEAQRALGNNIQDGLLAANSLDLTRATLPALGTDAVSNPLSRHVIPLPYLMIRSCDSTAKSCDSPANSCDSPANSCDYPANSCDSPANSCDSMSSHVTPLPSRVTSCQVM